MCVLHLCTEKKSVHVCLFICHSLSLCVDCLHICMCALVQTFFFFLMGVCVYFHMCVRSAVGDKVSV